MPYFDFEGKKVYYDSFGSGSPLILLHGNSVSSKMFDSESIFYSKYYKVYLIDYPGHGRSERIESFPNDFWFYNSRAVEKLIENENLNDIFIIGTSGGALVGLNVCANLKGKVRKSIFDSFFGLRIELELAQKIYESRKRAKKQILASSFWMSQHGNDWGSIVDMDLEMLVNVAKNNHPVIYGNLNEIDCPILLTGSHQDELIPDMKRRLEEVAQKIPGSEIFMSNAGKHPLMITQKRLFRKISLEFFINN